MPKTRLGKEQLNAAASVSEINTGTLDNGFMTPLGAEGSKYMTQYGAKTYAVAGGTNTYTASFTPAITSLVTGCFMRVKFTNTNTGASTLNINSLGDINLVKANVALASGDIQANSNHTVFYDGTNWVLLASSVSLRSIMLNTSGNVSSGTATVVSLIANDRIVRTLSQPNATDLTSSFYTEFTIPADFISFPTNAFSIDSTKNTTANTVAVTWGLAGVADTTLNALNLSATAITNTWETKSATPGSTYLAGNRILQVVTITTTANGAQVQLGSIKINYLSK